MATLLGIGILVGGPALGALGALALGATRSWQVMLAAVLGQGIVVAISRVWSQYVTAQVTRRALAVAAGRAGAPPGPGDGAAARPTNVVIRATGLTWRDHVVTVAVLASCAVVVGICVATVWRKVVVGD